MAEPRKEASTKPRPKAPSPAGPIAVEKRERIKLERVAGDKNRVTDANTRVVWYDARGLSESEAQAILPRIRRLHYTGLLADPGSIVEALRAAGPTMMPVVAVDKREELAALVERAGDLRARLVVASADSSLLAAVAADGFKTCLLSYVDDADSLHGAIARGAACDHLMIKFRDPTNIPLELVIASLQATHTVLVKEIAPDDVDDALVTLGVMEVGADGVMFSPRSQALLEQFAARLEQFDERQVDIEVATVVRTHPVGMGYRSCIDLATLFSETEGMLVGSTSQGGILVCPEVFYLPYMELRPFRVNAGAVHSYVYNFGNHTDYMTELRAGTAVMVVDASGKTRRATVGRMKTELRPLRLIEAEFAGGERINILMQDDWHVRIFSAEATPLNITELVPGDKILGHRAVPGRHVGIKVDEHIFET